MDWFLCWMNFLVFWILRLSSSCGGCFEVGWMLELWCCLFCIVVLYVRLWIGLCCWGCVYEC